MHSYSRDEDGEYNVTDLSKVLAAPYVTLNSVGEASKKSSEIHCHMVTIHRRRLERANAHYCCLCSFRLLCTTRHPDTGRSNVHTAFSSRDSSDAAPHVEPRPMSMNYPLVQECVAPILHNQSLHYILVIDRHDRFGKDESLYKGCEPRSHANSLSKAGVTPIARSKWKGQLCLFVQDLT